MPDIHTFEELTDLLRSQHDEVDATMPQVLDSTGVERRDAFSAVRQSLSIHETLEQLVLRPRAQADAGGQEVDARLAEEREAEQAIARLESLDRDSVEFDAAFRSFMADVREHAANEERDEFRKVSGDLDEAQREQVQLALRLMAQGKADILLGNTFGEMAASARRQLEG